MSPCYCNYFIYYDPSKGGYMVYSPYQGLYRNGYQSKQMTSIYSNANRRRVLYHTAYTTTTSAITSIRRLMQHAFPTEEMFQESISPETADDLTGSPYGTRYCTGSSNSMSVTLYQNEYVLTRADYLAQEEDVERYARYMRFRETDMGNLRRPFFLHFGPKNNVAGLDPDMRGEYNYCVKLTPPDAATDNPYDLYGYVATRNNNPMTQFIAALSAWSGIPFTIGNTQQIINIPMGTPLRLNSNSYGAWEPMDVYSTVYRLDWSMYPISFIREEPSFADLYHTTETTTGDRTVAIKSDNPAFTGHMLVLTADDLTYPDSQFAMITVVPYRATAYRDIIDRISAACGIYYDRLNLSQYFKGVSVPVNRNSRIVVNGLQGGGYSGKMELNATNVALLQGPLTNALRDGPVMQLVWDQINRDNPQLKKPIGPEGPIFFF
ncbi:hypothetical protein SPFM1_00131 [Salmonella phage SPFM1]|nr:hypothetical protein SPFM1_00131 [Salmonella phage SPFM1]